MFILAGCLAFELLLSRAVKIVARAVFCKAIVSPTYHSPPHWWKRWDRWNLRISMETSWGHWMELFPSMEPMMKWNEKIISTMPESSKGSVINDGSYVTQFNSQLSVPRHFNILFPSLLSPWLHILEWCLTPVTFFIGFKSPAWGLLVCDIRSVVKHSC